MSKGHILILGDTRTRANPCTVQLQTRATLDAGPEGRWQGIDLSLARVYSWLLLPRDMGGCPSPISSVLSTPPHGLTRLVGSAVAPRDMSHYLGCDLIWNHGLCGCHSGRGLVLRSSWICQGLKSKHLCHQATGEETDHEQTDIQVCGPLGQLPRETLT